VILPRVHAIITAMSHAGLRAIFVSAVMIFLPLAVNGAVPAALRDPFRNPPDDARPMVRWWWFGPAVTEAEIRREIGAMKAGGFGGFELQNTYPLATGTNPPGAVNLRFLSTEHLHMIGIAAEAAHAAGLRMDLTLGGGWPYGGATTPVEMAAGPLRIVPNASPALREGETLISTVNTGGVATSFIAGRTRMMVKRPAWGAEDKSIARADRKSVNNFVAHQCAFRRGVDLDFVIAESIAAIIRYPGRGPVGRGALLVIAGGIAPAG